MPSAPEPARRSPAKPEPAEQPDAVIRSIADLRAGRRRGDRYRMGIWPPGGSGTCGTPGCHCGTDPAA